MDTQKPKIDDSLEALNDLMTSLLEEHGIMGKWEQIEGSSEGRDLPGGVPMLSGTILTEDGRVFSYWLDWDPDKIAPDGTKGWYTLGGNKTYEHEGETLSFFEEVLPDDEGYPKSDDTSFLSAKRKLDLPMTEEELNILREEWKKFPAMYDGLRLDE